ncbi:TetR/AcrR family transcriptional regulator [Actinomadura algeriensis]|uniref:AcrR family transcriptional regulator n=1 Tax=Actinomadura algeriensis TaxID=1679523 RepID=A0ABR9JKL0_9ACTN|nr:TetR/AcrR family transcriptional regulator [Actinomadura algeriensis]MBE1531082.1 AcrR family transcriptional regulator [Actinomadura algeriensis]
MAHVPAAERRPQLVEAAIDLMARKGVDAGSTRAIAAELGVAQATVHYTFGTKRDLYGAIVERLAGEMIDRVCAAAPAEAVPGEAGFAASVQVMAGELWATYAERPGRFAVFDELTTIGSRDPDIREALRAHQHAMERTAAELVTGLAAETGVALATDALAIARFFLIGFDGLVARHRISDDGTHDADLDRLVTAIVHLAVHG